MVNENLSMLVRRQHYTLSQKRLAMAAHGTTVNTIVYTAS